MDLRIKKKLVVFGCSYMEGSEVSGEAATGNDQDFEYNLRYCVAGQLAHRYNLEYINLAKGGGGNDSIFRECCNYMAKYASKGHDVKDLFILIGWTYGSRIEFYNDGEWISWSIGTDPKSIQNGKYESLIKHFVVYMSDMKEYAEKKIMFTIALDRVLKSYGVDFLMINSIQGFNELFFKESKVEYYKDLIPKQSFFEPKSSFFDRYIHLKEHLSKNCHYDEYVHTLYRKTLDKFISNWKGPYSKGEKKENRINKLHMYHPKGFKNE